MSETPEPTALPELSDNEYAAPRFPWPPPEDANVLDAFVQTWTRSVFHPVQFYRAMPRALPLGAALLYYLVVGILGAALQLFWSSVLPKPQSTLLNEVLGTGAGGSPLVDFLVSPLYLLLSLFLAAGVTHLLVLMLVPQRQRFGTTLRVFCFAYAPILFSAVPMAGTIVAFIWMTVLSIIGVREAHETSTGRALFAVLLPVLVALFFITVATILVVSGRVPLPTP